MNSTMLTLNRRARRNLLRGSLLAVLGTILSLVFLLIAPEADASPRPNLNSANIHGPQKPKQVRKPKSVRKPKPKPVQGKRRPGSNPASDTGHDGPKSPDKHPALSTPRPPSAPGLTYRDKIRDPGRTSTSRRPARGGAADSLSRAGSGVDPSLVHVSENNSFVGGKKAPDHAKSVRLPSRKDRRPGTDSRKEDDDELYDEDLPDDYDIETWQKEKVSPNHAPGRPDHRPPSDVRDTGTRIRMKSRTHSQGAPSKIGTTLRDRSVRMSRLRARAAQLTREREAANAGSAAVSVPGGWAVRGEGERGRREESSSGRKGARPRHGGRPR